MQPKPRQSTLIRIPVRRAVRYGGGVAALALGSALGILSGTGSAPYEALLVTLSHLMRIPLWAAAWGLLGATATAIKLMGGRLSAGQVAHSLLFGPLTAAFVSLLAAPASQWGQATYLAAAVICVAGGLYLYLSAAFVSGITDTLFATISRRYGVAATTARLAFDALLVGGAWLGGGPVGAGTLIIGVTVAPLLAAINRGRYLVPLSFQGLSLRSRLERWHTPAVETAYRLHIQNGVPTAAGRVGLVR